MMALRTPKMTSDATDCQGHDGSRRDILLRQMIASIQSSISSRLPDCPSRRVLVGLWMRTDGLLDGNGSAFPPNQCRNGPGLVGGWAFLGDGVVPSSRGVQSDGQRKWIDSIVASQASVLHRFRSSCPSLRTTLPRVLLRRQTEGVAVVCAPAASDGRGGDCRAHATSNGRGGGRTSSWAG